MPCVLRFAFLVVLLAGPAQASRLDDVEFDDTVVLSDAGLSEADMAFIAEKMTRSLLKTPLLPEGTPVTDHPRVVVGAIHNDTDEPVDLDALGDRLTVALIKSGKFDVVDVLHRQAIAREYQYQASDYVDPERAHTKGKQAPVDFIISGALRQNSRTHKDKSIVDYRISLVATDIETGVARWAEDQAIQKQLVHEGISVGAARSMYLVGFTAAGLSGVAGAAMLVYSLAHIQSEETRTEMVKDDPSDEFSDVHFEERVVRQGRGPEPLSGLMGCGCLLLAPIVGVLTLVLVPSGNPDIE